MSNADISPSVQDWSVIKCDADPDIACFGKKLADPKGAFARKLVSAVTAAAI